MATKINIKPSKRGSLRKAMGATKGQKLSVSAMRSRLKNASPAMKKKLQFALNARKWKHELGGYLLPEFTSGGGFGGDELFTRMQAGAPTGGGLEMSGGLDPAMFSGIAGIGTGLIDVFARPDETGTDFRTVNINEGARAGKGALTGAATGMALGPIGAGIGAVAGALSGWFGGRKEEREGNIAMNQRLNKFQGASRLSTTPQSPTYLPVAKQGGFTIYKGETHDGPTGGILTDEQGNPTGLSGNKPIALTEKNEVSRFDPFTGSTYIYSDSLGFAKPARDLVNKFKLDKGNSLYKYDPLLREAVDKQFNNLTTAQEFAKETKTSAKESLGMFKNGGMLTAAKAGEMLKDGTANGHKLTPKQKRYFGWVKGGRMEDGGLLPGFDPGGKLPEDDWRFYDPMSMVYDPRLDNRTNLSTNKYTPYNELPPADSWGDYFRGAGLTRGQDPWRQIRSYPQYTPGVIPQVVQPNQPGTSVGNTSPVSQADYNNARAKQNQAYWDEVAAKKRAGVGGTGVGRTQFAKESPLYMPSGPEYGIQSPRLGQTVPLGGNKLSAMNMNTPLAAEDPYNPQLNPLGHVLSAVGNLADYAAMRKAKPTDVNLPRVGAERISLARQRLMNDRNASAARATNVSNTRKLGVNAGATFSNLAGSNTGVNRLLGEENMKSLLAEETTNAQMQQQANSENAYFGAQEQMINSQQQNAYKAAMARMNPLGNMARTAAGYFADNAAYGQGYDTMSMLAPNAELYGPNETWLDRFRRPKVRLRDKSLYNK